MARSLIVDKEGFRETPYWDVNAYRAGYGSDTYTLADGTVKQVQQGVNITRADADRDIDRRISTEFMPEARRAIGPDIWDSLPAAAQAALTSIAYNYGSVPGRVTRVAKSTNGNIEAIASAVEGLKNDDGGINSGRRQHEADMIRSSAGQAAASLTPPPAIGDQSSITPATVDNGGALSSTSQQVATAALAPKQTPIVQNIITGGQQQQQGTNVPNQVAFGTSHASQGGDLYSNMRVRSLVG
jgi:GH24 family phage-related lysozyme (muramidase)